MRAFAPSIVVLAALAGCGGSEASPQTVEAGGGVTVAAPTATTARPRRRPRQVPPNSSASYPECLRDLRLDTNVVPAADGGQELYGRGYAHELSKDYDKARRTYLELIQNQPRSAYVAPTYFAFGWLFAEDARSDPSKWVFVEQAMIEALKYPETRVRIAAHVELGRAYVEMGDYAKAERELQLADQEADRASGQMCAEPARAEASVLEAKLTQARGGG